MRRFFLLKIFFLPLAINEVPIDVWQTVNKIEPNLCATP